jgi:hypothetical protein
MIVATMVDASTADEAAWPAYDVKRARGAAPAPVAIAVFGDLILPGPRYDARFVHASSFGEPGALEGIRLMILAPTSHLNHRQRETVTALSVGESSAAGMPIFSRSFSMRSSTVSQRLNWSVLCDGAGSSKSRVSKPPYPPIRRGLRASLAREECK